MLSFQIDRRCSHTRARSGEISFKRGVVETPIFMPVGTLGSVKALGPDDLVHCGAQIILANTYHLYLRPGCEVIEQFEGLHRFMQWSGPILTDSGGFQIFSLAKLRKMDPQGVTFQSHIDGSSHRLEPETAIAIQACLDSDVMMCLDECTAYPATHEQAETAMELTTRWAGQCRDAWRTRFEGRHNLFGIVQGGMFADLRTRSAEALVDMDFPGYALGGLSVGEPKPLMYEMAEHSLPLLPDEKPKYIMGVGTPEDLVELVALGADMFDCVMPSRNARNGKLFTSRGSINISNARHKTDEAPIDENCGCYTCRHFSRAYLRHLYINRELLVYRLNTIHNIAYYLDLVDQIRHAIAEDRFDQFRKQFYALRTG